MPRPNGATSLAPQRLNAYRLARCIRRPYASAPRKRHWYCHQVRLECTLLIWANFSRIRAVSKAAPTVPKPVATASTPVDRADDDQIVHLKDPTVAAVLAWLIPGAGHIYQGRNGKGLLFSICILGAFFQGMYLGGGRVVYASWRPDDKRLFYACQIGVGLPALPALVQAFRVGNQQPPLVGGFMAPPRSANDPTWIQEQHANESAGELAEWEKEINRGFELGTIYTAIAGLLNILVIYDAWGGPMRSTHKQNKELDKDKTKKPETVAGP